MRDARRLRWRIQSKPDAARLARLNAELDRVALQRIDQRGIWYVDGPARQAVCGPERQRERGAGPVKQRRRLAHRVDAVQRERPDGLGSWLRRPQIQVDVPRATDVPLS